jgi:hypothetical protein
LLVVRGKTSLTGGFLMIYGPELGGLVLPLAGIACRPGVHQDRKLLGSLAFSLLLTIFKFYPQSRKS